MTMTMTKYFIQPFNIIHVYMLQVLMLLYIKLDIGLGNEMLR